MRPEIRERFEAGRKRHEERQARRKKPAPSPEPIFPPITADDLIAQFGTQAYHKGLRMAGEAIRAVGAKEECPNGAK